MTVPDNRAMRGDAGLSVLEMLVALAVCAMVVGVIAASLQGRQAPSGAGYVQIADFLEQARVKSMLSGEAATIVLGSDRLSRGDQTVVWDPSKVHVSAGVVNSQSPTDQRFVLFPDGTVLGSPLSIRDDAGEHVVPLPLMLQ